MVVLGGWVFLMSEVPLQTLIPYPEPYSETLHPTRYTLLHARDSRGQRRGALISQNVFID